MSTLGLVLDYEDNGLRHETGYLEDGLLIKTMTGFTSLRTCGFRLD